MYVYRYADDLTLCSHKKSGATHAGNNMDASQNYYYYYHYHYYLRERERVQAVDGERERTLSKLHTQRGASPQAGAQFHKPEIMTSAKIKSRTLN